MMETEGLPPVAFRPQNGRDRQPKRERDKPKPSDEEPRKDAPQEDALHSEKGIDGKSQDPSADAQEPVDEEGRVDIRI